MTLSHPQNLLLDSARRLAKTCEEMGSTNHGILVSGHGYRTALSLERRGLGTLRYQGVSLGWFTPTA